MKIYYIALLMLHCMAVASLFCMEKEEPRDERFAYLNRCCKYCNRYFDHLYDLIEHFKQYHPGEHPLHCPSCNYSCIENQDLTQHLQIHVTYETYCHVCQKHLARVYGLRHHMISQHPDVHQLSPGQPPVQPPLDQSYVPILKVPVQNSNLDLYQCCICLKVFSSQNEIIEHCTHDHFEHTNTQESDTAIHISAPYPCFYHNCEQKFLTKSMWIEHLEKTHTTPGNTAQSNPPSPANSPDECMPNSRTPSPKAVHSPPVDKVSYWRKDLVAGFMDKVPEKPLFKCKRCGKAFLSRRGLSWHICL